MTHMHFCMIKIDGIHEENLKGQIDCYYGENMLFCITGTTKIT